MKISKAESDRARKARAVTTLHPSSQMSILSRRIDEDARSSHNACQSMGFVRERFSVEDLLEIFLDQFWGEILGNYRRSIAPQT